MKNNGDTIRISSDEKAFTIKQLCIARSNCWPATPVYNVLPMRRTEHPVSIMALATVTPKGELIPVHLFEQGRLPAACLLPGGPEDHRAADGGG